MKKYQLMAPGPTPVPSQVLLAMAQPMIHHRTPEYEALFIEVRAGLKALFQTAQDVVPLTCSGTGAMEAAVVKVAPGRLAEALRTTPRIKAVLTQHSESSTGVLHDVRAYAEVARRTDAILIVDAVSSLGIADLAMDRWGIDVVIAGSQKGLMLPPGLAFCTLSEKAWAAARTSRLPRYYLDLTEERKFLLKNEARFTPAVSIVVGLREVL
ncbi:MAG: aminotransferase, partial [Candidatus Rokuibacteriota bacterium]